jgi:hypothetical protein
VALTEAGHRLLDTAGPAMDQALSISEDALTQALAALSPTPAAP